MWLYGGILVAAIVEGEIAYIGAAALVAQGQLNAIGVLVCGALGAAIGDQLFFFAFRGRLPRWMARYPSLQEKTAPLLERVRRHAAVMVFLVRFSPGLRIAITAACAWIEVPAWTFSLLNLVSAFVWALLWMVLVGWLGPAFLAQYGLTGWQGALVAGAVVLVSFKVIVGLTSGRDNGRDRTLWLPGRSRDTTDHP